MSIADIHCADATRGIRPDAYKTFGQFTESDRATLQARKDADARVKRKGWWSVPLRHPD